MKNMNMNIESIKYSWKLEASFLHKRLDRKGVKDVKKIMVSHERLAIKFV